LLIDHSLELYIFAIALLFTVFGIWLAKKLTKPKVITEVKTVTVEKEIIKTVPAAHPITIDTAAIENLGLSSREVEVLQLMAEGLSNAEIADRLFISLNTVKTHSARLFEKLDVKRRTQAVEKAKRLNMIH
jgi:ATP/maltotriose-dependent transcriptional regulator MalT